MSSKGFSESTIQLLRVPVIIFWYQKYSDKYSSLGQIRNWHLPLKLILPRHPKCLAKISATRFIRKRKHIYYREMVGVFDILYMPLRNPVDHFLLCYEPLEAEKIRLYPSSTPGLWLLLEFVWWWTKEIGESVEKETSGLIVSRLLSCWEVAKFLHWRPDLWSETLRFICRYVQVSLETAISIFFLSPVGLKAFMYPVLACLKEFCYSF